MIKMIRRSSVIVLLAALITCVGTVAYLFWPLPSTDDMREYFSKHRDALERANASILLQIAEGRSPTAQGNSEAGYRSVRVEGWPKPSHVEYKTHTLGFGFATVGTGIAYVLAPPDKSYRTLEAARDEPNKGHSFRGLVPLSGNWYAMYWQLD
jgi:hypothetical protein